MIQRILAVEDSLADHLILEKAWARSGHQHILDHVTTAEAGLQYLGTQLPDLILLDLNLPGMNGLEFLARLKSDPRYGAIPVLILSTSSAARDVKAAYTGHASAYFQKPGEFSELIELTKRIGDYWQSAETRGT